MALQWPFAFLLISPQRFNANSANVVRQVKFWQILSCDWSLNLPAAQKGKDILFSPDGDEIWMKENLKKFSLWLLWIQMDHLLFLALPIQFKTTGKLKEITLFETDVAAWVIRGRTDATLVNSRQNSVNA